MDAFILNYLFSYQIKSDKVGFPITSIERVSNGLLEKQISFLIFDGKEKNEYRKSENQFFLFLEKAQKAYNNQLMMQSLLDRIKLLIEKDSANYIKIKEFIDAL